MNGFYVLLMALVRASVYGFYVYATWRYVIAPSYQQMIKDKSAEKAAR